MQSAGQQKYIAVCFLEIGLQRREAHESRQQARLKGDLTETEEAAMIPSESETKAGLVLQSRPELQGEGLAFVFLTPLVIARGLPMSRKGRT